jgi:DNA-directed RNA polymerase subunit L
MDSENIVINTSPKTPTSSTIDTQITTSKSSKRSKTTMAKVSNIETDSGITTFRIENVNVSVVNALRRTILSDIPTVVIRTTPYEKNDATFYKNTCRLHNEILKQRLSSIPIHITDHSINFDDFVVEIKVKNTTDTIMYVTTKDFKIKNIKTDKYLNQSEVLNIFPPDNYTKDHIIFTRLRPKITDEILGEEIYIEAKMSIGDAKEDSMFNVVSTCSYSMTPDPITQKTEWSKYKETLKQKGYNDDEISDEEKNWYLLNGKRYYKPDTFDFIIKSIGVYENLDILKMACKVLSSKLNILIDNINTQTLEIKDANNTMIAFDIVLENDDYTIGKMIEHALYENFYKKEMVFDFVGFRKEHPHDTQSIIRLSFANNSTSKEQIYMYLKDATQFVLNTIDTISKQF